MQGEKRFSDSFVTVIYVCLKLLQSGGKQFSQLTITCPDGR